jgi:ketosteroid isomerase-like protein
MAANKRATGGCEPWRYEIRVRGAIGPAIMQAFPTLTASRRRQDTLLTGSIPDQSALYGLIYQLEALGLQLLEIRCPTTTTSSVMTPREVFDRHLNHEQEGDLDTILADYAPDAVVATPDGIGSGYDHLRKSYERVLPLISSLDLTSSVQTKGEVVYVTFRVQRDGRDELVRTDTFVIRDGMIHAHTFYATAATPAVHDRS